MCEIDINIMPLFFFSLFFFGSNTLFVAVAVAAVIVVRVYVFFQIGATKLRLLVSMLVPRRHNRPIGDCHPGA